MYHKLLQGGVRTSWYNMFMVSDCSSNWAFRCHPIIDLRKRSETSQHEVIEAGENDSSPITWLCSMIIYASVARQPPPRALNPSRNTRNSCNGSVSIIFWASSSCHSKSVRHDDWDCLLISVMLAGRLLWDWTCSRQDTACTWCNRVRGRH